MTKQFGIASAIAMLGLYFCTGQASAYTSEKITIKVIDDGNLTKYETRETIVSDFLESEGLEISPEDGLSMTRGSKLENGDVLEIYRGTQIIINIDGAPRLTRTYQTTVGSLLDEVCADDNIQYMLDESLDRDAEITNNMVIDLYSTHERTYVHSEPIPFETITRENDEVAHGIETVIQEGSEGLLEYTVTELYKGKELISTETSEKTVVTPPTNTIIEVGTKKDIATPAGKFDYEKAINVTATAYSPYDPGCSGVTAMGTEARFGVIAVDPNVIPLGTKVYIPGYGVAVAEDTGGAIKGKKIDVCYPTVEECYDWGVKNITIYILD